MCGIAGTIGSFNNTCDQPGPLQEALRSMAHRGPDGYGQVAQSNWQLGVSRLAFKGSNPMPQPCTSSNGRWVVVLNGEIYDYEALGASLGMSKSELSSKGDVGVLAELLGRRGYKGLAEVEGHFVIAAIDRQEKLLLLARDAYGSKPLYWAHESGEIAFASEVEALYHLVALPLREESKSRIWLSICFISIQFQTKHHSRVFAWFHAVLV